MANANQFLIGANDEHGLNPPTAGKRTPTMPYIDRSFYENEVNRQCKLRFLAGCARCGFNVYDIHPETTDTSVGERVRRANRAGVNALVTFGYNAYGNGLSFNTVNGYIVFYSNQSRSPQRSKLLSLDVSDGLATLLDTRNLGLGTLNDVGVLESVNCPSCLVESGFMTNFNEAKNMLNPIFCENVGEGACKGICDFLGVDYIDKNANKRTLRRGNVGSLVKYAQYLLLLGGYPVEADGVFGVETFNATVEFQQDLGLVADGIIGKNTWTYLTRNLNTYPTLRRRSRGAYVDFLQRLLLSYLYPVGNIDGVFGSQTENCVRQFQQENSLAVDGIVGRNTWNELFASNGREQPQNARDIDEIVE